MESPEKKPTADSDQAAKDQGKPSQAQEAPANYLIWNGQKLPCLVRAAVFQNGLSAGLGIKSQDDAFLAGLLKDPDTEPLIRDLIHKQTYAEFSRRDISSGIMEEEVLGAIDDFVASVLAGTGVMGTRKVAAGQPPQPGVDGKLVYALHANKEPLHKMMLADRKLASQKVHHVKPGDTLVARQPPEPGTEGSDVRGEVVAVDAPKDVSLEKINGPNTEVQGDKIVAVIEGVYFEDAAGQVQVVQEVQADEVNMSTGNLPRTGVATSHFRIKNGIRQGGGVFTTGDVLIGQPDMPASIDKGTQVHARHLIVNGQVVGAGLPKEFLSGETDALEESAQDKIRNTLALSEIEVQETFVAQEVSGRNISAGQILIGAKCVMSSLEAGHHVRIDGDLVGGVTTFGGRLLVRGNMGNERGALTRIRIGGMPREDAQKARLDHSIATLKVDLENNVAKLGAFLEEMEKRSRKSTYWQELMKGEKRAPKGPTERAVLMDFAKAAKVKIALEGTIADAKREIEDLIRIKAGVDESQGETDDSLSVSVRGTVHQGVSIEAIQPLGADDGETKVYLRRTDVPPVTIQDLKRSLTQEVTAYVEPRKERAAAQEAALAQMFKDRENKPTVSALKNKRFEMAFIFARTEPEESADLALPERGVLFVYASDPQKFYLKHVWAVREPLKNVSFVVSGEDAKRSVTYTKNTTPVASWHRDEEIKAHLGGIEVQRLSAEALIFGPEK
jgi:uncharacterized protein (DUF342 family)